MPRFFQTNPWPLTHLLELIHRGQIRVPQFQRSFVWDAADIHSLLISVSNSYPAGSLLFLRQGGNLVFDSRLIEGVNTAVADQLPCEHVVLDGQQRLTSLFQALYGTGDSRFFVKLDSLTSGQDLEESLVAFDSERADRDLSTQESHFEHSMMPLPVLLGNPINFDRWMDSYIDHKEASEPGHRREIQRTLRDLYDKFLRPIYEYEFPVVGLEARTPTEAVCNIFVSVNTTGTQLTTFELVTALLYPSGTRMRELWEDARSTNDHLRVFLTPEEADQVLRTIMLLKPPGEGVTFPSARREDLLKLTSADITAFWNPAVTYFEKSLAFLKGECGVMTRKWTPYVTILPPMSAAFADLERNYRGVDLGHGRNKLKQWFWCSVFTRRYDHATDTRSSEDLVALKNWFAGGPAPVAIQELGRTRFDASILRGISKQANALYRGVMCLLIQNGSLDFYKQTQLSTLNLETEGVDDHHVFPRKYMAGKANSHLVDCILNRTLIDGNTNKTIRKNAPSVYLGNIVSKGVTSDKLGQILGSHLLTRDASSALYRDDFPLFLDERQAMLQSLIDKVTVTQ